MLWTVGIYRDIVKFVGVGGFIYWRQASASFSKCIAPGGHTCLEERVMGSLRITRYVGLSGWGSLQRQLPSICVCCPD